MTKWIQIPITEGELDRLRAAARKENLSLAEWARRALRRRAKEMLGTEPGSPRAKLEGLFSLGAPVADVEVMIEESVAGRLR